MHGFRDSVAALVHSNYTTTQDRKLSTREESIICVKEGGGRTTIELKDTPSQQGGKSLAAECIVFIIIIQTTIICSVDGSQAF